MKHLAQKAGRLSAALLLAALLPATGQAHPPPDGAYAEMRFDTLDIEDGLAQNSVHAIVQDRLGLIWLGTEDGLHRYDGYEFTAYRKSGTAGSGLQSSSILALFIDSRGLLWAGTHGGGLHRMDPATGEIVPVRTTPPAANTPAAPNIVWDIAEDASGRIWFAGSNGAGHVDGDGGGLQMLLPPARLAGVEPADIRAVRQDADGTYWAFGDDLAAWFEAPGGEWHALDVRELLELPSGDAFHVAAVGKDGQERLVAAVAGRLVTLAADNTIAGIRELPRDAASGEIPVPSDLLADDRGNLWIATRNHGLLRLSGGRLSNHRHDPFLAESLAYDKLTDLFLDANGLLWIGTEMAGADRFDPSTIAVRHYRHHPARKNSLSNNAVWSFARQAGGPLWVATEKGLNRIDLETGTVKRYLHDKDNPASIASNEAAVLRFDEHGELWASAGRNLDRYVPGIDGFEHHAIPADDAWIMNFLPLRGARFLVATSSGFGVFDRANGRFAPLAVDTTAHPDLAHAYALALARAPGGRTWIGSNLGLLAWDGGSSPVRDVMRGGWADLHDTEIQDVTVLSDGRLALATAEGLALLARNPGSAITWYTEADGLPGGTLYAVREDAAGKLWISSNEGLLRIDPVDGDVERFDRHDGLQSDEFNGGAALVDAEGRLYFGGINGFNVFDPLELASQVRPPQVAITGISGFGDAPAPASRNGVVTLDWRRNAVAIDFMATDFTAPRSNRFQFRMRPLHEEWMLVEDDHRAAYADIPGGRYVFEVRAATRRGGEWSEPARLEVLVERKPWRTWWAYAFYLAAGLALVRWILQHQARKLAARQTAAYEAREREKAWSLYELATSLSGTLHPGEISTLLFKHVKRSVQPAFVALFAEQDDAFDTLRLECTAPVSDEQLHGFALEQRDFLGMLKASMQMRMLPGSQLADGEYGWLEDFQLLAVPMQDSAGRCLFLVLGRQGRAFDDDDANRVAAYANQALVALDKARLFAEVQALATRDELTGIANRRHLLERAELEFQRCERYRRPFAVLMIDFDHFKDINDRHGHGAGDRVLREAGQLFARQLRKFDLVARYGGEEFIMCLPETGMEQAHAVAERLRRHVEGLRITYEGVQLDTTVSIGAAASEPASGRLHGVIAAADAALYAAKAGGRNQVHPGKALAGDE